MVLGFLCSVIPSWKWHNAIDKAIQYNGTTSLVGMPTGRKHFFGEIHSRDIMIPVCLGIFCNMRVPLPGNTDIYLQKLYGKGYMDLPPENKREKHFIVEFDLCR
jgi:lipopolysaccharide cholinephosphotransferase